MDTITFGDDRLKATLKPETDSNRISFTLEDVEQGKCWGPVDLVALKIHDKAVKRSAFYREYKIEYMEQVGNGANVFISRPKSGIEVGLWLRIVDGELQVTQSPAELYERQPELFRLFSLDVLPELLTGTNDDQVYIPVSTGALFHPQDKPAIQDRFLIYLEQERWELCPMLPFCGVFSSEGGMMIHAQTVAADCECAAWTDGNGSGGVGLNFSYRRNWQDPIDMKNRRLVFSQLKADEKPVVQIGHRIRQHAVEDLGASTLRERVEESPEVKFMTESYIMKLFHGMENVGYLQRGDDSGPSFKNCMTFDEAGKHLKRLKDFGVDKVLTQCTGWNIRGHDGMYPTRFPVEPRVGGEEGFRKLIQTGNDLGYNINVHDNYMMNARRSPHWDPEVLTHDVTGEPLLHGCWAGGPEYQSWPLAFPEERLQGHMRKMKSLGLQGMYYMDYMIQPLEVNHHPRHKGPRGDHLEGQVNILRNARSIFGAAGTELGMLPAVVEADHVASAKMLKLNSDWPIAQLQERSVPIWDIAASGLVAKEGARKLSWQSAMNCVLFGDIPRDEWSTRTHFFKAFTDELAAKHAAIYDLCVRRFGNLKFCKITDYDEPSEGIREVTFDDGTQVNVDRNENRLFVNGENIEAPEALK